ncbi:hypothetical protein MKS88_002773 [Plasmodium brasilianum]|uniref:Uncharacterized protein n=1 Tax=Plasmodium brasilianum TaxID=5824 RepID=A0ACB9YB19_PLABR|nr:hypothetical protein MKS88_002773 [Plasmodium brasilianum]
MVFLKYYNLELFFCAIFFNYLGASTNSQPLNRRTHHSKDYKHHSNSNVKNLESHEPYMENNSHMNHGRQKRGNKAMIDGAAHNTHSGSDSNKHNSSDSIKHNSSDSIKHNSSDSIKHNSSDSIKHNSSDSIKHNSSDSIKHNSSDSNKHNISDSNNHNSSNSNTRLSSERVTHDISESGVYHNIDGNNSNNGKHSAHRPLRRRNAIRLKKGNPNSLNTAQQEALIPFQNEDNTQDGIKGVKVFFPSFTKHNKKKNISLNKKDIESSNIELQNKLNYSINPTLSLVASKAIDGLLGGVHKHMQGPFSLDIDGSNNSPLAPQIVTPNLYSNVNPPFNMNNGIPPSGAPVPTRPITSPQVAAVPSPTPNPPNIQPTVSNTVGGTVGGTAGGAIGAVAGAALGAGLRGGSPATAAVNGTAYPQMNVQNLMSASQLAQNPNFNIHPTGTNLRDDPGNVNYNEVVTITIGIVICLILFCFIFGCLMKMCKPAKRRR